VFGLVVDADALTSIRHARLRAIAASPTTDYTNFNAISEELEESRRFFRRNGWREIDITGKAVEENASRIIGYHELAKEFG
jgi:regulator of PEP synthase PpsR (kinase-PPPase family)